MDLIYRVLLIKKIKIEVESCCDTFYGRNRKPAHRDSTPIQLEVSDLLPEDIEYITKIVVRVAGLVGKAAKNEIIELPSYKRDKVQSKKG